MVKTRLNILGIALILYFSGVVYASGTCNILELNSDTMYCKYNRYKVWVSCELKLPILSKSSITSDIGNKDTSSRAYKLDPSASALSCQQSSNDTYSSFKKGFDVGHLTPIDIFDDNIVDALQTNYMTNMVPQASSFNRTGAWKRTETLTECYRDDEELTILAGILVGNNTSNDHYADSHQVIQTPDHLWKLIFLHESQKYDLWIIPNHDSSKAKNLPEFRQNIDVLLQSLKSEHGSRYNLVVEEISNIRALVSPGESGRKELVYNSNCHKRKG